jgi:hypothetical protein
VYLIFFIHLSYEQNTGLNRTPQIVKRVGFCASVFIVILIQKIIQQTEDTIVGKGLAVIKSQLLEKNHR